MEFSRRNSFRTKEECKPDRYYSSFTIGGFHSGDMSRAFTSGKSTR